MLDEIRNMLFFMALAKFLILCISIVAVYYIFKNDLIKGLNVFTKWQEQQDEMRKQKIELMKAQSEFYRNQNQKNNDTP